MRWWEMRFVEPARERGRTTCRSAPVLADKLERRSLGRACVEAAFGQFEDGTVQAFYLCLGLADDLIHGSGADLSRPLLCHTADATADGPTRDVPVAGHVEGAGHAGDHQGEMSVARI